MGNDLRAILFSQSGEPMATVRIRHVLSKWLVDNLFSDPSQFIWHQRDVGCLDVRHHSTVRMSIFLNLDTELIDVD
jgi:hypothetical protein